jgi:hypothetical protein
MNRSRYGTSKSFMRVGDWKCTQQAGVRFHWPQSCSILQHVFYIVLLLSTRQRLLVPFLCNDLVAIMLFFLRTIMFFTTIKNVNVSTVLTISIVLFLPFVQY